MLEEPLGAVVVEAVVDLVAEGGAVVLQLHQLPGQVQPLAVHLVGVGEYFVRRVVPAFLATKLGRQSYLDTNTAASPIQVSSPIGCQAEMQSPGWSILTCLIKKLGKHAQQS